MKTWIFLNEVLMGHLEMAEREAYYVVFYIICWDPFQFLRLLSEAQKCLPRRPTWHFFCLFTCNCVNIHNTIRSFMSI